MKIKPHPDLRVQRRLSAMRHAQDVALELFERHGFDRVTMEDVARAASVGPATLYRNFSTKERLVLWDEYDPMLLHALEPLLRTRPLLAAVHEALVACLDDIYRRDGARIRRRTRFILGTPAVRAAAMHDAQELRGALAALFLRVRAVRSPLAAEVMAATVVGTLDAAVTEWARAPGRPPLRTILTRAFEALERHGAMTGA